MEQTSNCLYLSPLFLFLCWFGQGAFLPLLLPENTGGGGIGDLQRSHTLSLPECIRVNEVCCCESDNPARKTSFSSGML